MFTVLIVDDEQFVRVSLRTLYDWESNGFEVVDTAVDGVDALEKIKRLSPDLVITDVVMPNMDGLKLLEQIKALQLSCVTLVLSNLGDHEHVKAAFKLGAEDYYLKVNYDPAAFHTVMQQMKEVLLRHGTADSSAAPARRNVAGALMTALSEENEAVFSSFSPLHVFCIRIKSYLSKTLSSFELLYRPLSGIVKEVFKGYPSMDFSPGIHPHVLLVAVNSDMPSDAVMDIMRRLDGQIQIYLQASADIFHLSDSRDPSGLFAKILRLTSQFSSDDEPALLYDDDMGLNEADDIERVKQYIEGHIAEHIALTTVAGHVNLNPSYLSRVFKQRTGVSLVNYITEQKMDRAAQLLKSGKYKVKEVSELLGIEDQYYFNKLFFKVFRMKPSEYIHQSH